MENKEKHIIDRIKDHREVVDTSDLWTSIEAEIGAPQKKRRPILWIWFGMFLLVLLGLVWQYQNNEEVSFSQDIKDLQSNRKDQNITISTNEEEGDNTMLDIKSVEAIELHETTIRDQKSNEKVDNQSRQSVESMNQIDHEFFKNKDSNTEVSRIRKNTVEAEKITKVVNERENRQVKSVFNETVFVLPVNTEPDVGQESRITIDKNNLLYDIPYLELIMSKVVYKRQHTRNLSIATLPPIEKVDKEIKKWAVGLSGGYLNTSRKLSTFSSDLEEHRQYRESIEKSIGGFDISASLTYRNGKWRIGSGISYTSLIDLAEFQSSNIRQKEGDETTIHYLDGSTNTVPTQNFVEETYRHKQYNTARFVSIPLNISFQFLSIGNIDFSLGVEGRYNIGFGYKGLTGETSEVLYDLTTDVDNRYKKKGVHQFGLNLMTAYPLSSTTVGMLNVGYAKTNKINTENYLIDQHYNLINLTAGIQWLF